MCYPAGRMRFMVQDAQLGAHLPKKPRWHLASAAEKIGFGPAARRYLCLTGGPADWRTPETPVINAVSHMIQRDGGKIIVERTHGRRR